MERAWDINRGGSSDVIVAILDTGVAFRSAVVRYNGIAWQRDDGVMFPALGPVDMPFAAAPDLGADRFVAPRDFIWDDQLPFDLAGHGTHVAGTVGQLTNNALGGAGMAFNVRLMPVKVIDTEWDFIFNSPFVGTDDTVARGIRYAVDNGAKVINMSIGRERRAGAGGAVGDHLRGVARRLRRGGRRQRIRRLEARNGSPSSRRRSTAWWPSAPPAATACAPATRRRAASSSSSAPGGDFGRGGSPAGILQQTLDLDLVETFAGPVSRYRAPRFDAFAYYYFEGTSMSTPHVSGLAALLMRSGRHEPRQRSKPS